VGNNWGEIKKNNGFRFISWQFFFSESWAIFQETQQNEKHQNLDEPYIATKITTHYKTIFSL